MTIPVTISGHNVKVYPELEVDIRERAEGLSQVHDGIVSCHVTVEGPGGHHGKGRHTVRLVVGIPANDVVINRTGNDDVRVAVRKAFEAAERKLEDGMRRRRDRAKPD